jgi:predicted sulfurtransferase
MSQITTATANDDDSKNQIKIILFYQYFPINVVEKLTQFDGKEYQELYDFQCSICSKLKLLGRVLVSKQGINGTLSGTLEQIDQYIQNMETINMSLGASTTDTKQTIVAKPFDNVDWKSSFGVSNKDEPFPDLAIRKVKELVASDGMNYDVNNNGGTHLSPTEFHNMLVSFFIIIILAMYNTPVIIHINYLYGRDKCT